MIADADAVLDRARREAAKILEKARARGAQLVTEEAVVAAAQQRAEEIEAEADRGGPTPPREADDYCDRQLAQFEIDLGEITNQVRRPGPRPAGRASTRRSARETARTVRGLGGP